MPWGTDITGNNLRWFPETNPYRLPSDERIPPEGMEMLKEGEHIHEDHYMRFQSGTVVRMGGEGEYQPSDNLGEPFSIKNHYPVFKKIK